jgi:hypothetical protein
MMTGSNKLLCERAVFSNIIRINSGILLARQKSFWIEVCMTDNKKPINIQPMKIVFILGFIVVLLVLASTAGQLIKFLTKYHELSGINFFDLDGERNMPTYFSSLVLFISSLLLGMVAVYKHKEADRYKLHWAILSIIFLCLSVDEAICIHENFNPLRTMLGVGGFLYYAWVIPGIVFVVVFAVSYLKFLFHLPVKSRVLFSAAAIIYVGGTLGGELIGGRHADLYGIQNLTYSFITTVEETLEMIGMVLFIYALLEYISSNMQEVRLYFRR